MNDLVRYCNNNIAPIYEIERRYENIIKRHFLFLHKSKKQISQFVFADFHKRFLSNTERKIRFIWGLLRPPERTDFINTYYILEDEEFYVHW